MRDNKRHKPDLVGSPRAVYGREAERLKFEIAMVDPVIRAIIATGEAGSGKTALVASVIEQEAERGAIAAAGKHAQTDESSDLAPLIDALEGLISEALDRLLEPEAGLQSLAIALGGLETAFGSLGSGALAQLAHSARDAPLSTEGANERLTQAVLRTLRWLAGFGQPILIFLDDWGRASERVSALYRRIIDEPALHHVKILATERTAEPCLLAAGRGTVRVDIPGLGPGPRSRIIRDLLDGDTREIEGALPALLPGEETLPFDLIQVVRGLVGAGALTRVGDGWRLDLRSATEALGEPFAEILARRLEGAGPAATRLAHLLALFGDAAEQEDLFAVSALAVAAASEAICGLEQTGIVVVEGPRVAFVHDQIRAAVLKTIDADARLALSAAIGDGLHRLRAAPRRDPRGLLMLRRRLEAGVEGIDHAAWLGDFLDGAVAARATGDTNGARDFAEAALTLAQGAGVVSVSVLKEATLAVIASGEHALSIKRSDQMMAAAQDPREVALAYEMRVFALRMSGANDLALQAARECLSRQRGKLPMRPTLIDAARALVRVQMASPVRAGREPPLTEQELQEELPFLRAGAAITQLLFDRDPLMAIVMITRFVPFRLAAVTALGAATYALICAMTGSYQKAAQWGAISQRRQSGDQPLPATAMRSAVAFGYKFTRPRIELAAHYDKIEALAYREGDLAVAAYNNADRLSDEFFRAESLQVFEQRGADALLNAVRLRHPIPLTNIQALLQFSENLLQPRVQPWRLEGKRLSAEELSALDTGQVTNLRRTVAMLEALLAVTFGAYGVGAELHDRFARSFRADLFQTHTQTWIFATGLALYRTGRQPGRAPLLILKRAAKFNPTSNLHRWILLQAEAARVRGARTRAMRLYERAVATARRSNCLLEYGLVAGAAAEAAALLGDPAAGTRFEASRREAWATLGAAGLEGWLRAKDGVAPQEPDVNADLETEMVALSRAYAQRTAELEHARAAAERANKSKSRFLATVGHELRTPLQSMVGLIDLSIQTGEPLDVSALRSVIGSLGGLVSDLTDLGAIDGGVLAVANSSFDPGGLVSVLATTFRPTVPDGRKLIVDLEPGCPPVKGDEGRIRQILSNLLMNAAKYADGDVSLRFRHSSAGSRQRLEFEVSDQGPGLTPEELVNLFEPFERGDPGGSVAGLGVGLAISRALARAMHGELFVDARGSDGTSFHLTLEAPVVEASADPLSPGFSPGLKVLIAEDSELNRNVLARLLEGLGCVVSRAADGEEALAFWRREKFDLLLLDLRMPKRDGLSVAREVRKDLTDRGRTPIVFATAAMEPEVQRAAAAGGNAVLEKPLGLDALKSILAQASRPPPWNFGADGAKQSARRETLKAQLAESAAELFAAVRPSVDSCMVHLREAVATGHMAQLVENAHRLVGLAGQFDLEEIRTAAAKLEAVAPGRRSAALTALEKAVAETDWSVLHGV